MRQACRGRDEELFPLQSRPGFQSSQGHFLSKLLSIFHEGRLKRVPSQAATWPPVFSPPLGVILSSSLPLSLGDRNWTDGNPGGSTVFCYERVSLMPLR